MTAGGEPAGLTQREAALASAIASLKGELRRIRLMIQDLLRDGL